MPTKKYYQQHREELRIKEKERYQKNKEYFKKKLKNWTKNNPDKVREQKRRYAKNHRSSINANSRKYQKNNREKVSAYVKEWRAKNKDKVSLYRRRHLLKSVYGITEDEYNKILKSQNQRCAICKKLPSNKKCMAVDHDHKTKKIRGLLCECCNRGIGLLFEDIEIFKSAIDYLSQ